jgi:hypothetical protein
VAARTSSPWPSSPGHARLETLKVYSHPTDEDKQSALRHLTVDR